MGLGKKDWSTHVINLRLARAMLIGEFDSKHTSLTYTTRTP